MKVQILKYTEKPYTSQSGWNTLGEIDFIASTREGDITFRSVVVKKKDRLWFVMPSRKDSTTGQYINFIELPPELNKVLQNALTDAFVAYQSPQQKKQFPAPSFPDEPWEGTVPHTSSYTPRQVQPSPAKVTSFKEISLEDEVPF